MGYTNELTYEFEIPTEVFYKTVAEKIAGYTPDFQEVAIGRPPYIQWNNMKLKQNKWLIEKSPRLIDGFTSNRSSGGRIEVDIIEGNQKTILKASIQIDTATAPFVKYFLSCLVGLAGLSYLIISFNVYVLIGLLILEALIFAILPKIQESIEEDSREDLAKYYNHLLRELQKCMNG
jgi:hypothetical protein